MQQREEKLREDRKWWNSSHLIPLPPGEDVRRDHNQLVPGYFKNMEYAICTAKQSWRGLNVHRTGCGFMDRYGKYRTQRQLKRRKIRYVGTGSKETDLHAHIHKLSLRLVSTIRQYLLLFWEETFPFLLVFQPNPHLTLALCRTHCPESVTALNTHLSVFTTLHPPWGSGFDPKCTCQSLGKGDFDKALCYPSNCVPTPIHMLKS